MQLIAELTPIPDIERCAEKAMLGSCFLAAASIIPGGKGGKALGEGLEALRAARATQRARELGRAGEEAARIVRNTQRVESALRPGKYRVPDVLDPRARIIGEVKNVSYLPYTSQLRDYVAIAQREGYRFDLYVGPSTQLSGPVREAIDAGDINLVTYLP